MASSPIGVAFGGPSPEHDISILTGLQAARSLADAGSDVVCLYWTKSGDWLRVPVASEAASFLEPSPPGAEALALSVPGGFVERKRLRSSALDLPVVLNCCHGGPGEDGTLAGLLALAGLRVTGPGAQASSLVMDKLATAAIASQLGVPTIETVPLGDGSVPIPFAAPWVVKPRFGGSSIGVEAGVADVDTALAVARSGPSRAGAVVQPFLDGWHDLNIAVRTYPSIQLSAIERPLRGPDGIYDYADKYLAGGAGMDSAARELPAQIPVAVADRIGELAERFVAGAGITGAIRADFLWDGEDGLVLCEVNSIPGAWGAYLWQEVGVSRAQLLGDLVAEAAASPARPVQWSSNTDGAALRVAGSVASKLV